MNNTAHHEAPDASHRQHDRSDARVARALVSTGVGLAPDPPSVDQQGEVDEYISIDEILERRAQETPEQIREPVPPLSINVGYTGAIFNDEHGKERREVFAILMVSARN